MSQPPNVDEYVVYLASRIDELEDVLVKCGNAINNLDVRVLMLERLLAKMKHDMEGKAYEEMAMKWWN